MRGKSCAIVISAIVATFHGGVTQAENLWPYDPSPLYPFGAPNPDQTDPEARIFDPMIGVNQCRHTRVDPATRQESESDSIWVWYYDMNGYGVRDLYRYGEGAPASQRIYDPETKQWHVWFFIGQGFYYAGEWVGGRQGAKLIFETPDEIVGGRVFLNRLEYYDITESGFKWKSTMIDQDNGETFVDWQITCRKEN